MAESRSEDDKFNLTNENDLKLLGKQLQKGTQFTITISKQEKREDEEIEEENKNEYLLKIVGSSKKDIEDLINWKKNHVDTSKGSMTVRDARMQQNRAHKPLYIIECAKEWTQKVQ